MKDIITETDLEGAKYFDDLIRNCGLSARRLALLSGVDPAIISKLRSGKRPLRNLTVETAYRLSKTLGLPPDKIIPDFVLPEREEDEE